jgi:hypothetical protein
MVHPRCSKLIASIEAKHYLASPGLGVGRAFIGLAAEIGQPKCTLAFPASGSSSIRPLLAKRRSECYDELTPGAPPADGLRAHLDQKIRNWAVNVCGELCSSDGELTCSLPRGRLQGMSSTTIKVDTAVRDRLAVLARERGTTMGALLAEATDALERQMFFARAKSQLEGLRRDDPEAWRADRAESQSWQLGTDRDTLTGSDEPGWWE